MKKILLSALSVFTLSAMNAQVAKKPLIEHFTQASCAPCASQNPTMYATLNNYTGNYCKVTYQTSWPGTDPMNAAYPEGPQARVTYYAVTGVPDCSLNGGTTAAPNTAVTTNTMNAATALTTPYQMNVTQTWNTASSLSVRVSIVNTTASAVSTANRLHLAMVEDHVTYATAPGSNGEKDFYFVLRQFYTATGMKSETPTTIGSIPANDSLVFNFTLTSIPSHVRDIRQLSFVGFLQTNATKAVHQSAKSTPSTPPNALIVSAAAATTVAPNYCDLTLNAGITFTNNDPTPVTTVTAEYAVNGGAPVSQVFTGNLAQGQSTTIAFPQASLIPGTSTITYAITDINSGGGALFPANTAIPASVYNKLQTAASATPLTHGFQGLAIGSAAPVGVLADNPLDIRAYSVTKAVNNLAWNLGGFGNSDGCFRWDYYAINNGQSSKLVFGKLDLTNTVANTLTFSHAHALYGGTEPDRLRVRVSTDCGTTWATVWDKQGSLLATAPNVGNARFYPTVAQWAANSVDLSAYDGQPEVLIAFEGISGYGNSLYVDDINTSNTVVGISTVAQQAAEVRIMPNPVSDRMAVEFTMLNSADATMNIVNALGQQVQQVTNGTFTGTNIVEVNTSNLVSGVYFLNITSDAGTTTKRFVVEK